MQTAPLLYSVVERGECPDRSFSVLIAYDNIAGGRRAMRICSNLAEDQGELRFRPEPWRFDLIADPDWRECATEELLRADLVIISAASRRDLPATIHSWLAAGLLRKTGAHGAVVVLLGPDYDMEDVDSPNVWFVRNVVEKAGIEFFAPPPRVERCSGLPAESVRQPEGTVIIRA